MEEIIYFSVNNWFCGRDYPDTENFKKWLGDDLNQTFRDEKWAKENKLCIYYGLVDMSWNYTVAAPKSWVEKNCPELLSDEEYTYTTRIGVPRKRFWFFGKSRWVWQDKIERKKYSDFVYSPEEAEEGDRVGYMPFPEYREENFGSEYYETDYWKNLEEDEEDNE